MTTTGEIQMAKAIDYQQRAGLYFLPAGAGWWFSGHLDDTDAVQRVGEYERTLLGHSPMADLRVVHGFGRFSVVGRHSRSGYRELRPAEPGTQGAFPVTVVLLVPDMEW